MSTQIFRKSALEKLSTPEKLDQLITVVDRKAWIPLIGVAISVTALVLWGLFGVIETKVSAQGMLLGGGVHDIVPLAQGQLKEIKVNTGQKVSEGDIVAVIDQPVLEQQLAEAKAKLAQLRSQHQEHKSFGSQDIQLQVDFNQQQKKNIEGSIIIQEKSLAYSKKQLDSEKKLFEKGLITKPQLVNTEQTISQTQSQIDRFFAELKGLSSKKLNTKFNQDQRVKMSQQSIDEHVRYIQQLQERYKDAAYVKSSYDGNILEIMVDEGEMISPGLPMFKLIQRSKDEKLKGILFISAKDGKRLALDMPVQVAPITVKAQEHGYMKGTVKFVSEYPATSRGVMRILKNQQLTQQMMMMGAPFEVLVEFEEDPNTYSKFAWTSGRGPEVKIHGGTMCTGMIRVEQQKPVTLVVPAVKKFFGAY
jgi:HlyD family secretion protein